MKRVIDSSCKIKKNACMCAGSDVRMQTTLVYVGFILGSDGIWVTHLSDDKRDRNNRLCSVWILTIERLDLGLICLDTARIILFKSWNPALYYKTLHSNER